MIAQPERYNNCRLKRATSIVIAQKFEMQKPIEMIISN